MSANQTNCSNKKQQLHIPRRLVSNKHAFAKLEDCAMERGKSLMVNRKVRKNFLHLSLAACGRLLFIKSQYGMRLDYAGWFNTSLIEFRESIIDSNYSFYIINQSVLLLAVPRYSKIVKHSNFHLLIEPFTVQCGTKITTKCPFTLSRVINNKFKSLRTKINGDHGKKSAVT